MTDPVIEQAGLVEQIARALAKRNYPSGSDADIDEMWEGWADDARSILPIIHTAQIAAAKAAREEALEEAARLFNGNDGKVIPLASNFASLVSGNNMPDMSGDNRNGLHPHVRRRFDDVMNAIAAAIRALSDAGEG